MFAQKSISALCFLVASTSLFAIEDLSRPDLWVADDRVKTGVQIGNSLYIGGDFNYVGPLTGGGAEISPTTAAIVPGFPRINGDVYCALPDGSGGWYLGGFISHVNGQPCNNLIHVLSNGTLDPNFTPNVDSGVTCIALDGTTLYIGGFFSNVNSTARSYLAALNTANGALTAFNVAITGFNVKCMALDGTQLYIGGEFTDVGGSPRAHVARVVTTGAGSVDSWSADANGGSFPKVNSIKVVSTTVYVGGEFTSLGGQPRSNLAAVTNNATPTVLGFDPSPNNPVFAMDADATRLYIGGTFTVVDGEDRNRAAAVDLTDGSVDLAWNPNLDGFGVYGIDVFGTDIYLVGEITAADSIFLGNEEQPAANPLPRFNSVRIGADDVVSSWAPVTTRNIRTVAVTATKVLLGGTFHSIGGVIRNGAAALDLTTGVATAWNPDFDSDVNTMIAIGDTIYLGGHFTLSGGTSRNKLAAMDTAGNLQAWDPNVNNGFSIDALASDGTFVYAGGNFTEVGLEPFSNLVRVNAVSGAIDTGWNPSSNGSVFALKMHQGVLYVGGSFSEVGGESPSNAAAVSTTTGLASTEWLPNPDASVHAIEAEGSFIYLGGTFNTVGGQPRARVAEVTTAGLTTAFSSAAAINNGVDSLTLNGPTLIVGGNFSTPGPDVRNGVVELIRANGSLTAWNPYIAPDFEGGPDVDWVFASGEFLYVGGSFDALGESEEFNASNFAAFALGNPLPTNATPNIGTFAGGTTVTITGDFFAAGATVVFGSSAAQNVVVVNANTITCVTPAGALGPVDIRITNPDATFGLLENGFTYVDPGTPPNVIVTADRTSAATGATINFTATATDPDSPNLSFSWDFKDGSTGSGATIPHVFTVPGEFAVTVTVSDGLNSVSASITVTILSAASGGDGIKNIAENKPPVSNPLNGISIGVERSNGGVIDLTIDVDALNRAAFDVETQFTGFDGRSSAKTGTKVSEKFNTKGLVVATSTAMDTGTQNARGKARKTLAVSSREVGEPVAFTNPPASTVLEVKSLKGKFVFVSSKPDTVTYTGQAELPEGLNVTLEQELQFGMGNVIDRITIDKKGKGKGSPTSGRIKKVQIKYPRVDKKNPVTKPGQFAKITITYVATDLPADGFDTEGLTAQLRADEAGKKVTSRSIQTAMVLAGVTYEAQVPVEYKVTPKQDAGSFLTRSSSK